MAAKFAHLHVHSEYSLLDGASRISDLVKRAADYDMSALALTDHGVMYGIINFYESCQNAGIKPIVGCEVYTAPRTRFDREANLDSDIGHLLLLCENDEGYRNLVKIVSLAHLEGFYYKPRTDKELLQQYSNGLIATSACLGSPICKRLMNDDYAGAKREAQEYREIFGPDNFFLELQNHGLSKQHTVNEGLIELSNELGIPMIAANDTHYTDSGDADAHDILLRINTGKLDAADPDRLRFGSQEFYFKSPLQMAQAFPDHGHALAMTAEIADRCNVKLQLGTMRLPEYEVPSGLTQEQYLQELCEENLPRRYPERTPEIKKRLDYELNVIGQKGYSGYMLIVWDFVRYARDQSILVGPGRGSATGSLVSYILGITNIDPLEHGLVFERFLNPERPSPPDIDLDFPDNRRDEIIRYVQNKYGEDRVAQIVTFGTLQARAAVRDVARALEIPIQEADKLAKLISFGMSINEALQKVPDIQNLYRTDEKVRQLFDTAAALEGLSRHASTHACGVVIGSKPLIDLVPLQRGHSGEGVITQYEGPAVEKIGLVKMDFLGLSNSTIISSTLEMIRQHGNIELDLNNIDMTDKKTYRMLGRGESVGIFQLESSGMRQLLRDLQPDRFEHIIQLVALFRPGPMEEIPRFVECRHGRTPITYMHPKLEPILKETYGVITYQEQVMRIANELAGFTMPQADILRAAMGKKQLDLMEKMRQQFIDGCLSNEIEKDLADRLFERARAFAGYGFNKSHSAGYALIAYQTAYLKANFPVEYMTALLSTYKNKKDKFIMGLEECRRMNVHVLPPDINHSSAEFTVEGNSIRFGLSAIKNVGESTIESILETRDIEGTFADLFEFVEKVPSQLATRSTIESLVKAGAFDESHPDRGPLAANLGAIIDYGGKAQKAQESGQATLFAENTDGLVPRPKLASNSPELSREEKLSWEKELLGVFLSDNPLTEASERLQEATTHNIASLRDAGEDDRITIGGLITACRVITDKRDRPMAFITLEDLSGEVEVIIFAKAYEQYAELVQKDQLLLVDGRIELRTGTGPSGMEDGQDTSDVEIKVFCRRARPIPASASPDKTPPESPPNDTFSSDTTQMPERLQIHISVDKATHQSLAELRAVFQANPGTTHVELLVMNNGRTKRVRLGTDCSVRLTNDLSSQLQALLGKNTLHIM